MKNILLILKIFICIGVVYLFSCCNGNRTAYSDNNKTNAKYDINYYIDTINGHVILSTVCESNYNNDISISTLELK